MNSLAQSGLVALGAALGANLRFWIGISTHASTRDWPWSTLLINALGSLVLGVFMAFAFLRNWNEGWRLLVGVGFCGGFTTFSTFSFEAVELILKKNYSTAAQYILASLVVCILFCWLGGHFGAMLARRA